MDKFFNRFENSQCAVFLRYTESVGNFQKALVFYSENETYKYEGDNIPETIFTKSKIIELGDYICSIKLSKYELDKDISVMDGNWLETFINDGNKIIGSSILIQDDPELSQLLSNLSKYLLREFSLDFSLS